MPMVVRMDSADRDVMILEFITSVSECWFVSKKSVMYQKKI